MYLVYQDTFAYVEVRGYLTILNYAVQEGLQVQFEPEAGVLQHLIWDPVIAAGFAIWKVLESYIQVSNGVGGADFRLEQIWVDWRGGLVQYLLQLKDGQFYLINSFARIHRDPLSLEDYSKVGKHGIFYFILAENHFSLLHLNDLI